MNGKTKAILVRIENLGQAVRIAKEYLEGGKHADWAGFRPLFVRKRRDGKELPPHKDWVRNAYLPRALSQEEKTLERLDQKHQKRSPSHAG
jgi:hypothetical protein